MKRLTQADRAKIDEFIVGFRALRDKVALLEDSIGDLLAEKDHLMKDLDSFRSADDAFVADLEARYGPGKLDVVTMTWLEKQPSMA